MKYFKDEEFVMGDEIVYSKMDRQFLVLLDALRECVDFPLKINSSYRSKEYNDDVGGMKNSMHLLGKAVDIACTNSVKRAYIVGCAIALGLTIGVSNTFIHVDNRNTQILFNYGR